MNKNTQEKPERFNVILLTVDVHLRYYKVCRKIDRSSPQAPIRMEPNGLHAYVKKQKELANQVHVCYEAGCFGFVLARELLSLGVNCYVIRPKKLDPYYRGVRTDTTDCLHMMDDLERYVGGNRRALAVVKIPTGEQELKRARGRQRKALQTDLLRCAARGRSLLLMGGRRVSNCWWKERLWERLKTLVKPEELTMLEVYRRMIEAFDKELKTIQSELVQQAPQKLPVGFGALTYVLLQQEMLDWSRFKTRRQVGGFLGLCGGVSSSGDFHVDLSLTQSGHKRLRTLFIELAWRWVRYQPQATLCQKWMPVLADAKSGPARRKKAIVALARQLSVEVWKWRTDQATPEQLGWVMAG